MKKLIFICLFTFLTAFAFSDYFRVKGIFADELLSLYICDTEEDVFSLIGKKYDFSKLTYKVGNAPDNWILSKNYLKKYELEEYKDEFIVVYYPNENESYIWNIPKEK